MGRGSQLHKKAVMALLATNRWVDLAED